MRVRVAIGKIRSDQVKVTGGGTGTEDPPTTAEEVTLRLAHEWELDATSSVILEDLPPLLSRKPSRSSTPIRRRRT